MRPAFLANFKFAFTLDIVLLYATIDPLGFMPGSPSPGDGSLMWAMADPATAAIGPTTRERASKTFEAASQRKCVRSSLGFRN